MIKLDEFNLVDSFFWERRKILREAMECAKRHAELMWYVPRCVAIKSVVEQDDGEAKIFGAPARTERCMVYTIEVWGHELEIPEEFKHWTERLQSKVGDLISGVWIDEDAG